jgi:DNA-binding LacI/PurR family transcriptional regulator
MPSQALRIAVLLDHLESDYHADIVGGVLRAAHSSRVRTLIVAGGWLARSSTEPVVRNFIYDLLLTARLDGVLVLAGSLSNYCGLDRFREWLGRFQDLPLVAVGVDLPGVPSVHVDNEAGVYRVVSHLIEAHDRRRIAFISGPDESSEARARLRAYRRALDDHEIPGDERLVLPGGLGREQGRLAINELIDARHFTPTTLNAVIGVNDDVALGALEELLRRGISVPNPVAVVGFDDAASAQAANPPLTTVDQRVELQAYTASRALIEALEQGRAPQSAILNPEPVIRASCGCVSHFANDSTSVRPPASGMARTCRLALIERRATIIAELARAGSGRLLGMSGWEARLIDSLTEDLATAGGAAFVREMEQLVRRNVALGRSVMACHDVLTTLRLQTLACASLEPTIRPLVEDLFQESRMIVARIGADVERDRQQMLNYRMRITIRACLPGLYGSGTDPRELGLTLEEHLPAIGIRAFCISRFADSMRPGELVVTALRSTAAWASSQRTLGASELGVHPSLEHEDALVVEPLEFAGRPQGIAVFTWGAQDPVHYEQLREVLGVALHADAVSPRPADG